MGKFREFLLGEYNDLGRALQKPELVKSLTINLPENLNDYGAEFARFTKLQSLDIQTKIEHLSYIPEQIGNLKQLKRLSILNVPFLEFPEWIFGLINLEYLRVRGCEITTVPYRIRNLSKLKTLRIENCELNVIPPGLKEMQNICYLSLTDTKIKAINVEDLPPNLRVLNINMNHIDHSTLQKIKKSRPELKFDRVD